ncbi:DUF982 domain-containing protein [Mesorhizobium sp.]|uniref:DUF982 domain-containing protein n=1 Tax=Mesorhizobium sp. TaxID=1871066 RepID=UPI00120B5637|nr:DUF982 domain-containing protein [Mesorhizobium sp.]TIL29501.1 MAG: DUF982 domain-containing protein [Mesorhizobium sp.]
MALHWFDPSAPVRTDRPGLTINVNNVETAAQELLKVDQAWPKWKQAVETCMAAVEGDGHLRVVCGGVEGGTG